jgi:hypothetical protein
LGRLAMRSLCLRGVANSKEKRSFAAIYRFSIIFLTIFNLLFIEYQY